MSSSAPSNSTPSSSSTAAATADASASSYAKKLLMREFDYVKKDFGGDSETSHSGLPDIECELVDDNIFEWAITLVFLSDFDEYQGAVLKARLSFPPNFPMMPPKMRFISKMFHPNIYPNGEVCISILHPPENDQYGYESIDDRWRPMSVKNVLLSVISMLPDPNADSPANPDAATLFRENRKLYKRKVRELIDESFA